jgi:hypothetical protein
MDATVLRDTFKALAIARLDSFKHCNLFISLSLFTDVRLPVMPALSLKMIKRRVLPTFKTEQHLPGFIGSQSRKSGGSL